MIWCTCWQFQVIQKGLISFSSLCHWRTYVNNVSVHFQHCLLYFLWRVQTQSDIFDNVKDCVSYVFSYWLLFWLSKHTTCSVFCVSLSLLQSIWHCVHVIGTDCPWLADWYTAQQPSATSAWLAVCCNTFSSSVKEPYIFLFIFYSWLSQRCCWLHSALHQEGCGFSILSLCLQWVSPGPIAFTVPRCVH